MKKTLILIFCSLLIIGCSEKKEAVSFFDESRARLEKAVNFQEGKGMRFQDLDTIFTAKIHGTDSIFMIGYKFTLVAGNQKKLRFDYLYKNLHGEKKELLISTLTDKSIEEGAKEIHEKTGGSYRDALFVYALTFMAFNGNDIE